MKILFVIDSLRRGGAERQLVELIKGLGKDTNHELHLVCLMESANGYEAAVESYLTNAVCFQRRFKFDFKPVWQIKKYIRKHHIDLVHSFLTLGALFGVFAARLSGSPVVCSGIRDAKDQSKALALYKKAESLLSDIFIANSYAGFNNRFKKMRPHYRVIYNGMDFKRFEFSPNEIEDLNIELETQDTKHVVGMVASLTPFKDHKSFIRAIPDVLKVFPDTIFLIVGDGPERKRLERFTNEMGTRKQVRFTGFRSDVEKIYRILDISVLLSQTERHLEGISNTIIESMACKIPVIATKGGGTEEIVQHMKNGVLISSGKPRQLAQEILQLFKNRDQADAMASRAYEEVISKFSLQRYVDEHINVYRELKN